MKPEPTFKVGDFVIPDDAAGPLGRVDDVAIEWVTDRWCEYIGGVCRGGRFGGNADLFRLVTPRAKEKAC